LNGKEDSARASIAHWASEVSILLVEDAPRKEAHRRLVKKEERKLLFSFVLQERKLLFFCLVIGEVLLVKKKGPYGPWLIINSVSIQNVNVPFIQFLPFLHRQGGLFLPMLCHGE
jgi:hypothetical protein